VFASAGASPRTFTQIAWKVDDIEATVHELRPAGSASSKHDLPGRRTVLPRRGTVGKSAAVGHGSAPVVVDDLDVVPVRVEHERAVVARVVDRRSPGAPWSS
jgi:hypothetical protein